MLSNIVCENIKYFIVLVGYLGQIPIDRTDPDPNMTTAQMRRYGNLRQS